MVDSPCGRFSGTIEAKGGKMLMNGISITTFKARSRCYFLLVCWCRVHHWIPFVSSACCYSWHAHLAPDVSQVLFTLFRIHDQYDVMQKSSDSVLGRATRVTLRVPCILFCYLPCSSSLLSLGHPSGTSCDWLSALVRWPQIQQQDMVCRLLLYMM